VRPLRGRESARESAAKPPPGAPAPAAAPAAPPPQQVWRPPPLAPLAPLEPRTRRRLARRLAEVDARLDLHGMRQERAYAALATFLRQAQLRGARIVLVVTGKGGADGEGRGVLRQVVPGWLSRPDFRPLVVGFEEAERRHGGAGALYVQVRRRRGPVEPSG
jgi:DNA-nicking Smr family endonuclease